MERKQLFDYNCKRTIETAKMLANAIKKIDTDRPITSAIVDDGKDWSKFDTLMAVYDVSGYNYHLWSATSDHKRVPSRVIVQTESYPKDAFTNWNLMQENNYVIGDFVWTAIDYLGETDIGRTYYSGETPGENWDNDMFPWHGAYCGDIDLIGWRKPISHYRSMLYNNNEKLYMAVREPAPEPLEIKETWWSVWPTWESWAWPGFEGRNIDVKVYSKYPKVRLYQNNKLVNGQDLSFVTIEITDKNGISQPNAANRLHFKIDGPGTIAGVGNADMKDTDTYVGNTRKAWKGRVLVVIKSIHDAGDIKLTVTSPGLSSDVLTVRTSTQISN